MSLILPAVTRHCRAWWQYPSEYLYQVLDVFSHVCIPNMNRMQQTFSSLPRLYRTVHSRTLCRCIVLRGVWWVCAGLPERACPGGFTLGSCFNTLARPRAVHRPCPVGMVLACLLPRTHGGYEVWLVVQPSPDL